MKFTGGIEPEKRGEHSKFEIFVIPYEKLNIVKKLIEKNYNCKKGFSLSNADLDIFNRNSSQGKLVKNMFVRFNLKLQRTCFPNMCLDLPYSKLQAFQHFFFHCQFFTTSSILQGKTGRRSTGNWVAAGRGWSSFSFFQFSQDFD